MVQPAAPFSATHIEPHVFANERTKFGRTLESVKQLHGGGVAAVPVFVIVSEWLSAVESFKYFANDSIEVGLAHGSLFFEDVQLHRVVVESGTFFGRHLAVQIAIPWKLIHDKFLQCTHAGLPILHIEILFATWFIVFCQRDLANYPIGHDRIHETFLVRLRP